MRRDGRAQYRTGKPLANSDVSERSCGVAFPPKYSIVKLSMTRPPTPIEMRSSGVARRARFDHRKVIQFSKICEPLSPTPYDESDRFR